MKRYEDFETGEPPHRPRRMYCEHLNVLARRGDGSRPAEPGDTAKRVTLHRPRPYPPGLLPEEIVEAERIWARLPDWNALVRGNA